MSEVKLYDSEQAREYLKFKQRLSVIKHAASGQLKGNRIGRVWVFTQEQLDEFKANRPKPGPRAKKASDK